MLGWGAVVGYPVLGLSYLLNKFGGIVEAVFFLGFTLIALFQLAERLQLSPDDNPGMMSRWEETATAPAPPWPS